MKHLRKFEDNTNLYEIGSWVKLIKDNYYHDTIKYSNYMGKIKGVEYFRGEVSYYKVSFNCSYGYGEYEVRPSEIIFVANSKKELIAMIEGEKFNL